MSFTVNQLKAQSASYRRVVDAGLAGFGPFTRLQPWCLLPDGEVFDVTEQWPSSKNGTRLVAFAVRQDCDDIACFEFLNDEITGVVVVEGWSEGSYSFVAKYQSFDDWFNSAVADRPK